MCGISAGLKGFSRVAKEMSNVGGPQSPCRAGGTEEGNAFQKFELEVAKVSPFVPAITLAAAGRARQRREMEAFLAGQPPE